MIRLQGNIDHQQRVAATSLARRLALGITMVTAVVVGFAALTAWNVSRWSAMSTVDARLNELRERAPAMSQRPPPFSLKPDDYPPPPVISGGLVMRFRTSDGAVLLQTPGWPDALAPLSPTDGPHTVAADGQRFRVLCVGENLPLPGPDSSGQRVTADAAISLTTLEADSRKLGVLLFLLWLGSTTLAALSSLILRKPLIAPVAHLSQQIAAIDADHLSARIAGGVPPELSPIVMRTNELLLRLDQAFQREKETIATIAHELRTPLTVQRGILDFALLDGDRPLDPQVARRCLNAAIRMQRLIEDLLSLARIEAGHETPAEEAVDLVAVTRQAWDTHAARASARHITCVDLDHAGGDDLPRITSAASLVEMVVSGLLSNAIDHSAAGEKIRARWQVAGDHVTLSVRNHISFTAEAAPPDDQAHAGRPDRPRHLGIGLPLCQRIMRVLGGSLRIAEEDGVFVATLNFPRHR